MDARKDSEEKKEYCQIGYTVRTCSNNIAVTQIPLFVCLNDIERKIPIEKREETINRLREYAEKPYKHTCNDLVKNGYALHELKEGFVLTDTKDKNAKLIYETAAVVGLRDNKGNFTDSFQLVYQILISPKKTCSEATENMISNFVSSYCSSHENELFEYIEKKKAEKKQESHTESNQ
jgi:hypothetical protein